MLLTALEGRAEAHLAVILVIVSSQAVRRSRDGFFTVLLNVGLLVDDKTPLVGHAALVKVYAPVVGVQECMVAKSLCPARCLRGSADPFGEKDLKTSWAACSLLTCNLSRSVTAWRLGRLLIGLVTTGWP